MTMLLVHPGERWLAADRRACYGDMYMDTFSKIRKVDSALLAVCGTPRLLDVACEVLKPLVNDFRLFDYVSALKDATEGEELVGDIVLVVGGVPYTIDENKAAFVIEQPMAFGSGTEGGQPLLNGGIVVDRIFELVASCNYTVSKQFDLEPW